MPTAFRRQTEFPTKRRAAGVTLVDPAPSFRRARNERIRPAFLARWGGLSAARVVAGEGRAS